MAGEHDDGRNLLAQDELDLRVLEYVYDNDQGMMREPAGLSGLYDVAGSEDAALQTAAGLRRNGLISMDQRLSGGYHIEPGPAHR